MFHLRRLVLVVAGCFLLLGSLLPAVVDSYNEDEYRDISFLSQYSLHYTGCSSIPQLSVNHPADYYNNNKDPPLIVEQLAHFTLCPTTTSSSSSTTSCSADCKGGGQFVLPLDIFIDAYTESLMSAMDYYCELVREACYCDDANDDVVCEATCYANAGLQGCMGNASLTDSFLEEVDIQRYLQCRNLPKNQVENGNQGPDEFYYIGPYCNITDGQSIHLGLFTDPTCSTPALVRSSDIYRYTLRYGIDLPYATNSMIVMNENCMDCKQTDQNNPNSNIYDNNVVVADVCEEIYASAVKCEQAMSFNSTPRDNTGCDYIQNKLPFLISSSSSSSSSSSQQEESNNGILPALANTTMPVTKDPYSTSSSSSSNMFQIWTGIFAGTTVVLAMYIVLRDHRYHNNNIKNIMDKATTATKEVDSVGAKATPSLSNVAKILPSVNVNIDL